MTKVKCTGCNRVIPPIRLEFGGVHYSIDGDPYCSRQCHDRTHKRLARIINGDDKTYERWLAGEEVT